MKKIRMWLNRLRKARHPAGIALASLLVGQSVLFAASTPFSRIVVFGDSTSDTGNYYRMSSELWGPEWAYPPSPPYWEGHLCNGPMWVEFLAQDLGMATSLDDYAVAGATTGHENFNVPLFGGVRDQITLYLSSHPGDPNALYVVWAGHNDIFIALTTGEEPAAMIGRGVGNTVHNLQALREAGARHILVLNVTDVGGIPAIRQWGPAVSEAVSTLCEAYNHALEAALQELAVAGIPTIRLDACTHLRAVVSSPSEYGFTNVTDPYLPVGLDAGIDPAQVYFWDDAHPTTRVHRLLADAARNGLIDYYSPRSGKGGPPALVNALNGLVQAGKAK